MTATPSLKLSSKEEAFGLAVLAGRMPNGRHSAQSMPMPNPFMSEPPKS
jgi:hypothetical protein